MNWLDLFLTSYYVHYANGKGPYRYLTPWVVTCFSLAYFLAITATATVYLLFNNVIAHTQWQDRLYVPIFILVLVVSFLVIKLYFFDTGRHQKLSGWYLQHYSTRKRRAYQKNGFAVIFGTFALLGLSLALIHR